MKGGIISRSEILTSYMEEIKKDLIKHLEKNVTDDMSVTTSNEDEENCLAEESQIIKEMDIKEFLQQFPNQVKESSITKEFKGK